MIKRDKLVKKKSHIWKKSKKKSQAIEKMSQTSEKEMTN